VAGLLVLAALAYGVFVLVRSVPAMTVVPAQRSDAFGGRLRLAWPSQGEAAVGLQGVGLIGSHGSRRPTAIASIAKVMTAYLVLHDHPLQAGAGGPQITVVPADVAAYRADRTAGQSVVAVRAGERLTERQALEGMLLPSGNNIATLLARWDAGSERAFVAKMNTRARALGLAHTRYTGASGVRASTVSTASDQVRLAMRAMEVPALRLIVAMPQATLPVAGRQYNKDALLGQDGIIGIKTGTTSQAGGCFVFAARQHLAARSITVVGAVLHQVAGQAQLSMIDAAFHATTRLLASTRQVLVKRRVVRRGTALAWLEAPWAERVALRAARPLSLIGWPGLRTHTAIAGLRHFSAPVHAGQEVGTAVVATGEQREMVRLVASRAAPEASLSWRLAHP
jgi:serine-type D-Ala-D-Ala carboxypeptidase (penicillin-binding protein 5/6)